MLPTVLLILLAYPSPYPTRRRTVRTAHRVQYPTRIHLGTLPPKSNGFISHVAYSTNPTGLPYPTRRRTVRPTEYPTLLVYTYPTLPPKSNGFISCCLLVGY